MGSEDIVSQNTSDAPLTTRVPDTLNLGSWHKSLKDMYILSMYQKEREQDDVLSQNITFLMYINIRVFSVFVVTKGGKIASFCGHSWGDKKSRQIKVKC